ncbi:50S ribosomal protein L25/general stress protein Ctc [Corynebacterium sp. ES2794-CONJ1]|uniref:50S ribosomal protein L25/general stress protein Ctc n=1 Tax=unclassified Corynebacterium TaxID=2624378 RepID=UPI002168BA85|nr:MULTISPECIES: 50S ribosomal protein L25/general stress protein Ctc [unclassified Corynebacterium]MCS4489963.1 50S ribosomal protein L25/general stress protein Ctc [Corynebacterium sp. ES2775-CONJ]MCS4491674.1 50S ribosomal protein L25/general stress protein Ctc [Corynebacterium sp. ES2715-CONJ3]MCS4531779.1 50S ribosomal protein L25/general stress protein Ctc [Corynebacterium sp. ES2730-CONJ]MCU9519175.1 50S ribosomal protein L25/general stress protein Ctc [Corynebacterium sp. ES2794-CONJ1]
MAQDTLVLSATPRQEFGKGVARRLRAAGRVPGVIYGQTLDNPVHFSADLLEIHAVLRNYGSNAVFELDIEGDSHMVMIKHVDQNVLTFNADHIDLLAIKRGEKVEVEVPVVFEGETEPGTQLVQDIDTILVEADVFSIPEEIIHNIEGLNADDKVLASDIELPAKTTLILDPETVIASVSYEELNEEEVDEDAEEAAEASEGDAEEAESEE